MKRLMIISTIWTALGLTAAALAADAETSASAGGFRGSRSGTATATASFDGDVGFTRTDSRSGRVNVARGVAVGFDEDGLSLSISNAIDPRFGPAIATNFNMSIDRDGDVSTSGGLGLVSGPGFRQVTAGGATGTGFVQPHATSFASGDTDARGRVIASTRSYSSPRSVPIRVIHQPRPEPRRVIVLRGR